MMALDEAKDIIRSAFKPLICIVDSRSNDAIRFRVKDARGKCGIHPRREKYVLEVMHGAGSSGGHERDLADRPHSGEMLEVIPVTHAIP